VIVGVSFDAVADNCAFAEKYGFPYQLLCDTDQSMSKAYGACADKGAKYPERITYVIDKGGTIVWAEKVTDIDAHVPAALAQLAGD